MADVSLPKEIIFAVKSALPRKALLRQVALALAALHALHVPGSVQHVEQKPVQDRPLAAGAVDHGSDWEDDPRRKRTRTRSHAHTHTRTHTDSQARRPGIDRESAFPLPRFAWSSRVSARGAAARSGVTTDFFLHASKKASKNKTKAGETRLSSFSSGGRKSQKLE